MLIKIIGWVWVMKVKRTLFFLTLFLAITLIMASFKAGGLLPKIVMILGIIGIFKAFFFLKSKAADKIIEWFGKQPLKVFRIWAVSYIVIGLIILNFHR